MTKNNLVIVESPAKAKTIGRYLGSGYTVKASMGHVRDLPKSKIGIDFDHDFQPDYQPIKGKEEVIADLKEAAEASDNIYLATDPDREGEAISWHLKELLEIPNEIPIYHQPSGHRLDTSGGQPPANFAPEQGGELVAYDAVQQAACLLGVH